MRISIRLKILIFFTATLIVASALNLFVIGQILKKDYKSALYSELLVLGDNLQSQLKRITSLGISTRDIEGFNQQCLELVKKNERTTQAMVIDRQGTIIYHSDPSRQGGRLLHKDILSSISEGREEIYSVRENNESVYFAVFPFGDILDYPEYAVVITSPADAINDRILSLINKCNIVLFSTFGLAVVLLLASLRTMLTAPLTVILNTMRDITETRNLQERVDIKANDEIGQIADAFNKMTADLEHTTTSIDNLNREIAERKRAEEKLTQLLSLHTATLESTEDGILVVDLEGKVSSYNRKFLELWRIPADLAETRDDNKLLAFVLDQLVDPEEFMTGVRRLYSSPDERSFDNLKFKDGRTFERSSQPQKVGSTTVGRVWCFRDVTEQKKAEEEIRKSREVLQEMIDAMPFGVVVIGEDKKIKRANITARQLTGYSENELVGKLCHQTLCPADVNNCPILDLNQVIDHSERKLITRDGRQIPIIKSVVQLKLGDENVLLEAFTDITERKEAEKKLNSLNEQLRSAVRKLEEANQDMKDFVYIASHDLREPLRKITAFGTMLQKSFEGKLSADDAENLQFMIEGAQRLTRMIEGLLVYSRVSTRGQSAQVVNLNEIVTQLQQLELAVLIEEKQVTIEVPQPLPCVEADPVQIRQVMQNLIANGVKYQKKDSVPHIRITSKSAADGMVRIEVTDNGIGIAPEYQGAVFTMFKRLYPKDEYEGTGIGLAVCKKIVERHGGQIGIESEPDKGSTFWFTMPYAETTYVASVGNKDGATTV